MNTTTIRAAWPALAGRLRAGVLATLFALLAGCSAGLDGGGDGVGSGGTGTYSMGPISGFGSVIVNGVRFDDSAASVVDDDDTPRSRGELQLGMTVEVDGGEVRSDASGRSATARRVRFGSALVGAVSAVDVAAGTLVALGQTVSVGAGTVFDERLSGGLAALAAGRTIEVYGLYDAANGRLLATRIAPAATGAAAQLRATVSSVDATARVLRIGAAAFSYSAASGVPGTVAAGDIVRLRLRSGTDALGRYLVDAFLTGVRTPDDRDLGEIEGTVTAVASASVFRVGALTVDASAATFPNGTSGLRLGARVQIRGVVRSGVLRASTVEVTSDAQVEDRGFELKGAITALDTRARSFVLRGQTVGYGRSDLRVDGGTLADLAVGRSVEVKAVPTADRSALEATRLKFVE